MKYIFNLRKQHFTSERQMENKCLGFVSHAFTICQTFEIEYVLKYRIYDKAWYL